MKQLFQIIQVITLCLLISQPALANSDVKQELNEFWQHAASTVKSGDFEGYSATFHPDAILVSDIAKNSKPISHALARWKQGFDDTKAGKMKAGVSFRFIETLLSEDAAHQTGYFHYYTENDKGEKSPFIAKFEALLVKKNGQWQMIMERHVNQVDMKEWDAAK